MTPKKLQTKADLEDEPKVFDFKGGSDVDEEEAHRGLEIITMSSMPLIIYSYTYIISMKRELNEAVT